MAAVERPLTALPELLVSPLRPGELLVSNPFVRTWAVAEPALVDLLAWLREPRSAEQLEAEFGERRFRLRDATTEPYEDGLLGDPTGLDRAATLDGAEELSLEDTLALLRKLMLAVDDLDAYAAHMAPRKNVLDRGRRGNLHQRVGEYVLLGLRRRDFDEWWVDQKFTPDRRDPREGPYSWVQGEFMDAYFTEERLSGRRVLDFGTGPGLFARLFAGRGATVLGMDTNEAHLETAGRLAADDGLAGRTEFRKLELPVEEGLAPLAEERFDLIFLSDVLMFYFHTYDPRAELDPVALLRALGGLLADGGRIAVLEPNGTFWQQPWLGAPERPFTILSEYRNRRFGVTPTLEQLSRSAEAAGLVISRVRELVPANAAGADPRAVGYAAEFPLWWYFELQRAPR
jgi:SAM-dependent methyltransferase